MIEFNIFFNKFIAILIFLSHALLFLFLILIVYVKILKKELPLILEEVWEFTEENSLILAFFVVLAGILGSLIYSEVIGIPACDLCWIQRIVIYPQIIIIGLALYHKSYKVFNYVLSLNIIGLSIAIYQYFMQMINYSGPCPISGGACFGKEVFEFGYITISLMSITLMVFVLILTYIWKNEEGKKQIKGKNIQKIEDRE